MPGTSDNLLNQILTGESKLLNLLMNSLPELMFIKGKDLSFVQVNRSYVKLAGLVDAFHAVGKKDSDFFKASDGQDASAVETKVIESGVPAFDVDQKVSNKAGETFCLSGHRLPIKNQQGEVIGILGLVHNVTSVKRMEQELRNVNVRLSHTLTQLKQTQQKVILHERLNALGEMASGVAHDFNNALMPILGYADVLISKPELLSKTDETIVMLKDIRIAAMDAAQAVRRLREFYRTSAEDENFKGNLNKQIETAVILTRPKWQSEMGAKGIRINVETNLQEIPFVNAKESQLREILINLMLNAVDAMPNGGTITINTMKDDDMVVLEVCDSGVGMAEEVRQKCLEPFFTTKGDEGTGLGLSMVYGFVKRRNGSINIDSAPGKGTKVSLVLPSGENEHVEQKAEMPVMVIPAMRVLVIDDESYARKLFGMYLKADNHSVEFAENGLEGLEKFSSGNFDLVITDRAMPDMSGDQVALAIREKKPGVSIIMVTGFGDIMNENKQCPKGVDVVVCKPVTHSDLQRSISQAVGRRA
ncbi:MAG: hypothetical protein A2283_13855 [Lentisphaerae bacterium RIFOXYA12_FULL_48_11]|nr:MAG: hypothetical protein A2283_13855 [Lentisphaerae bacterium RIFOXYA12_FULL_48_11]